MKNLPMFEQLESRELLSTSLIVSFYGLGGAGGFGNDWLDNIANDAGKATGSVVRKYDEDQGGQAVKDTLRTIDTNHNMRIDKSEVAAINLRVIGYSLGGVQAANFAIDLLKVDTTIKGYLLHVGVPIKALVTLDPVQSILKSTNGVPDNVYRFGNYYQEKGGDTTIDLYTQTFGIKVSSVSVPDPSNIMGGPLNSAARTGRQIRVDQGAYADVSVKHQVYTGLDGKLKGKDVNHGTLPFYAYDWSIEDLTA